MNSSRGLYPTTTRRLLTPEYGGGGGSEHNIISMKVAANGGDFMILLSHGKLLTFNAKRIGKGD